jgi:hypothetical protein
MVEYTVTLTDEENKALSYAAYSQQGWIDNAVHERCRVAIDEICQICVEKCLETGTQIPGSKDAMVNLAFQMGWVVPAKDQPQPPPPPSLGA